MKIDCLLGKKDLTKKISTLAICCLIMIMAAIGGMTEEKKKISVNCTEINNFRAGEVLYCYSEEYPNIKLNSDYGIGFTVNNAGTMNLQIELVEGDRFIKDLISVENNGNDKYIFWIRNAEHLDKSGSAVLRLYGETKDGYVDEIFPVKVEPFKGPEPVMNKHYIHVDLEESTDLSGKCRANLSGGDAINGYSIAVDNGDYYTYSIENEEFSFASGRFVAHKKGIYRARYSVNISNVGYEYDIDIYAGDYPYVLSTNEAAFPGSKIQINADVLISKVAGAEIVYSTVGNDNVEIESDGHLIIGENASGEVLVQAKPTGTDMEPSELTVKILGYDGKKAADTFSPEAEEALKVLEETPIYIPSGYFGVYNNYHMATLSLTSGEKITKVSITPVNIPENLEALLDVYQANKVFIRNNLLFETRPTSYSFLITAESNGHYAQKLLTFKSASIPDTRAPSAELVIFVKEGETVNLFDYITTYPKDAMCFPMAETDKKDSWAMDYHGTGKKRFDLVSLSETESMYTAHSEGTNTILFWFGYGNLISPVYSTIICSDTLKEEDFEFTVEGGDISAGQKLTIEPIFANPDLVNAKAKNNEVDWSVWVKSDSRFQDIASIQNTTITAKQNVSSLQELEITFTSKYCPSKSATATVYIHPKATGIEASIEKEQLFLRPGMETAQILATAVPTDAIQRFIYKSSAPKVATVDENGLVTAVASGKATITVSVDDGSQKKKNFTVTVVEPVSGIQLEAKDTFIQAGRNKKITAVFTPEKPTNMNVSWSIADSELSEFVKIDKQGNVSVKNDCPSGTVTVIAIAEGSLPGEEIKEEIVLEIVGKDR